MPTRNTTASKECLLVNLDKGKNTYNYQKVDMMDIHEKDETIVSACQILHIFYHI